jgi:hypothetical protein
MAGCSWYILAVGLLGCTRTCQMAQQSSIARLNGTYRTAGTYRGQTGTPLPASTHQRLFLGGCDRGHRGRRAVVLTSTFPAIIADGSARRRWPAHRAASARPRVCGRDAAARRAQAPARGRYLPSRSLKIPLVMPAIPTSGLAQSRGIILAIRIIRPRGVLSPNARGIKPNMYQTLGSPEQSIIVRSFDCLVIEVQVVLPLLDQ